MDEFDVAVLGATGVVGEAMLAVLAERQFPVRKLYPLASHRSKGKEITFQGETYPVLDVAEFDFTEVDIALFSAGGEASKQYGPLAAEAGCVVIDNSSQFRYDDDVPLVIPEVNPDAIESFEARRIIANPNCSTIQMLVALKPIHDAVGLARINVATYQAVSGAGQAAIDALASQSRQCLSGQSYDEKDEVFSKQIAFNVIPQVDVWQDNGYSREEMKMVWETQKILQDDSILVNPTAVRVPVFYGHSEAIHCETCSKITLTEARDVLKKAPGVVLLEDNDFPTAATHIDDSDGVYVGRLREDISHPMGLNLWVVADNVRKGAALNAVQIAELLWHQGCI